MFHHCASESLVFIDRSPYAIVTLAEDRMTPSQTLRCRSTFLVVAFLATLATARAASAADSAETAIRKVMDASVVAWDAGDLTGFMDTYEDSPDTLFVGEKGLVRGKAAITARYASAFGGQPPGKLTFDVLEIRPTGPDYALMIGRYHLQPAEPGKPEASGLFSLTFHQRAGHWRIVCDHTS
jgi:uncharacterized protein (TIGR02246 family)